MSVKHVLLVCLDEADGQTLKTTGQLALAACAQGIQVSILTNAVEGSEFEGIHKDIQVFHSVESKWPAMLGGNALVALRRALKSGTQISHVHFIGMSLHTMVLGWVCQRYDVPFLATALSDSCFELNKQPFGLRKKYLKHLDYMDQIVVSNQMMLEKANLIHLDNILLIKEGVDTDRFKPVLSKRPIRRELELPEGSTIVCCMADIEPANKQLETLKMCMPLGDYLQVIFLGKVKDVAYFEKLKEEMRRTAVEPYVIVRDAVMNPEDYLRACDVFMLLGGVEKRQSTILEAQSCGLPVVLEASNSALALTNGNKTGVVLYPNNALAKGAVEKLLSDPNFRQGKALYARPFVKKEHEFKDMLTSYIRLYQSL
ncbi:MAG: glycosyltransferase family 4 protein [Pseudomonadota bacterium]|nr:glycosyltransferase family 4 protein [Pseudomonadota bacterium]